MTDANPIANLPAAGKLLGLDLGTKTIGVAISDGMRYSATPLETIKRSKFTADAARLLSEADAPVIFAGNGVLLSDATDELKELAELLTIPVATTLMGKGAFPERHPLSLGMTGIWGTAPANNTTLNADVVLGIGTAFGEADCSSWDRRFTFAIPPARLIQIDIDPQEVGKIYPVEVGLVGDARATLRALIGQLRTLRPTAESTARIAQIAQARAEISRQTARALNTELLNSDRWLSVLLPLGDGVTFATRR